MNSLFESPFNLLVAAYLTDYNLSLINHYEGDPVIESFYEYILEEDRNTKKSHVVNSLAKAIDLANLAIEKCRYFNIGFTSYNLETYPEFLKGMKNAPPFIFYKGDIRISGHNYAIVGSRKPSQYAEGQIKSIVETLKDLDFNIVSGLAEGVDTLAHNFALAASNKTIAVLPTPLDNIYPLTNLKLVNNILKNKGLIISELPFGINRGKLSFIQRNRIISGISNFTIPIEMTEHSGTMHTLRFAFNQNKPVVVFEIKSELISHENYAGVKKVLDSGNKNLIVLKDMKEFKIFLKSL